jgi:hypothetical protein
VNPQFSSTKDKLTTPRAAAAAGILFSVLMIVSLILIWISIPPNPQDETGWLPESWDTISLALNLIPFAGIAFLWFIGVVRDQLGQSEDKFFATAFFGSGLLLLALWFASAGVAGGTISMYGSAEGQSIDPELYKFGRSVTYTIMNSYALKMAGVFTLTTCTLSMRSRIFSRWMIILGFILGLLLLLNFGISEYIAIVFPLWILVISIDILITNLKRSKKQGANQTVWENC